MNKALNSLFLASALLLSIAMPAHADEAGKLAKAEKLVETMHLEKNMSQMMDMVTTQMKQSFSEGLGTSATPKQKEVFDDFMDKVFQLIRTQLSWNVVKPDMVKLYADNFTEEELDGLNTFYASPVGQSTLEKMPVVTNQSMIAVQAHLATLQPQMKALQEDFAKQLAATTSQAPAKSGAVHHTTPSKQP